MVVSVALPSVRLTSFLSPQAEVMEAEGELEHAEMGADITDVPAPAVPAVASGEVEKVKKKRKKSDLDAAASGSKNAAAPSQVTRYWFCCQTCESMSGGL